MRKRTKIIATLGPSTTSSKMLTELIAAGTDVFRLNLSHAKIEDAREIINKLKSASLKLKKTSSPVCNPTPFNETFLIIVF